MASPLSGIPGLPMFMATSMQRIRGLARGTEPGDVLAFHGLGINISSVVSLQMDLAHGCIVTIHKMTLGIIVAF
jgi:hypothetical protein